MKNPGLRVKTEPVLVRIYTAEFVIEGNVHEKPGGYAGRITDLLNMGRVSFLPVTEARYIKKGANDTSETTDSECIVVRAGSIELLEFI